jgi:hypothetical protein
LPLKRTTLEGGCNCHELHHAAGGMMQKIEYMDFDPNYTPDPNNDFNNPE